MAFVVYHADTGELERHMTLVAALYRMTPIVILACVWDRVVEAVRAGWKTKSAPAT
jgi:hypothetical protein